MTNTDNDKVELKPCPFCASSDINTYACDDDSFIKTIVAECSGCGCRLTSNINWRPYSDSGDRKGYEAAWKVKIAGEWNRRAALSTVPAAAPPGWKLVPIKPTQEMIAATADESKTWTDEEIYRAMIDAAPIAQPVENTDFQKALHAGLGQDCIDYAEQRRKAVAQPVVWRMVTPDQGNVIFLTDPAAAKRFKEMDGREVRPLGYIDASPTTQPALPEGWLDQAQELYNKVAFWPENQVNGMLDLLALRNHVGNLLKSREGMKS